MLKSGKRKWSAKQGKLVKPADKLHVNKSYKKVVMKRALSLASEVPMYLKKFLARFVGLTVANVVSAAKTRFAPCRVNRSQNPQFREVPMFSIMKKLFASIARLNPAGAVSAAKTQPLLLTFTLMVAAFGVSSAVAAEKKTVTDPATGQTWTAPEYGGTLTWAHKLFPKSADVWEVGGFGPHFVSGVNEKLSFADWGLSREKHFDLFIIVTPEMTRGNLAESWSQPDPTTFIWNIRQGVNWDNKPPVSGRQFDAYDVEWNYHRYFGLGDFTEDGPSPQLGGVSQGVEIESVTATDKWTVEIKHKPGPGVLGSMLNNCFFVYAREVVEKYGDAADWRNVVGTGPYRLTEHVEGSSATWQKNPNYWGYDEKFPQNRLPYIDTYYSLLMPDMSTRLAAMRTGKIDMIANPTGAANIYSVDDADSLQLTNPEIEVWPAYLGPQGAFLFNWALPPVDDPIVRKALQMSVDRETISTTYFKGYGDPTPGGFMGQKHVGWAWPMEDWPDDVKAGYRYDPAGAEALLDEAGYTRGADGYRFKLKLALYDRYDPTYPEIVMGYFDAIGVDSELVMQSGAESAARDRADTAEWHLMNGSYQGDNPIWQLSVMSQNIDGWSYNKAKDPRIDALYRAARESIDIEEVKSILRQADEIAVREHWA